MNNYFGFPQDLSVFSEYCKHTGALLIEDNAQGLFSKDKNGNILGTRGDFGIFSFRKTMPIFSGAALVINNNNIQSKLRPQIAFKAQKKPIKYIIKNLIRNSVPYLGVTSIIFAIKLLI